MELTLLEVLDTFYSCTYLPITAVDQGGNVLGTAGLTDAQMRWVQNRIAPIAQQKLQRLKTLQPNPQEAYNQGPAAAAMVASGLSEADRVVYLRSGLPNALREVCFAASYICPCSLDEVMFLLGPYSDEPDSDGSITYRPEKSFPYLLDLLRKIYKQRKCPRYQRLAAQGSGKHRHSLHVQKAIEYVYEHYHEKLSLCALARHLQINQCYLSSLFRQETGMTFSQFVNQVRVEKSKEYLRQTDNSILDIALEVGFSNQNYFATVFKKFTGMTPNEYRTLQAG